MNKPYDSHIELLRGVAENVVSPTPVGLNPNGLPSTSLSYPAFVFDQNSPGASVLSWTYQSFRYITSDEFPILSEYVYKYAASEIETKSILSNNGNVVVKGIESGYVSVLRGRFYNSLGGELSFNMGWAGSFAVYKNGLLVKQKTSAEDLQETNVSVSIGWNDLDIYLYSNRDSSNLSLNINLSRFVEAWEAGGANKPLPPVTLYPRLNKDLLGLKEANSVVIDWDIVDPKNTKEFVVYRRGPFTTGLEIPQIDVTTSSGVSVSGTIGIYTRDYKVEQDSTLITGMLANLVSAPYWYSISAVYSGFETEPSTPVLLEPSGLLNKHVMLEAGPYPDSGNLPLDTPYTYLVLASTQHLDISPASLDNSPNNGIVQIYTNEYANKLWWTNVPGAEFYKVLRASGFVGFDHFLAGSGQLIDTTTSTVYYDSGVYSGNDLYSGFNFPSGFTTTSDNFPVKIASVDENSISYDAYATNAYDVRWTFSASGQMPDYFKLYRSLVSGLYESNSVVAVIPVSTGIVSGIVDSLSNGLDNPDTTSIPKTLLRIGSADRNNTSFVDSNLKNNGIYEYRVSAKNFLGVEGEKSPPMFISAGDKTAPATPTGISVTGVESSLSLSWTNGGEIDYYQTNIYYSTTEFGSYSLRLTSQGESAYLGVGYSTTGYYKLSNVDFNGNESALSSVVTGVTGPIDASSVSGALTGYVKRVGDTMTGPLIMSGTGAYVSGTSTLALKGVGVALTSSSSVNITSQTSISLDSTTSTTIEGSTITIDANGASGDVDVTANGDFTVTAADRIFLYTVGGSGTRDIDLYTTGGKIQLQAWDDDINIDTQKTVPSNPGGDVNITSRGTGKNINLTPTDGDVVVDGRVLSATSGVDDLGSSGVPWRRLYVNEIISTGVSGNYVSKTGDTMTGALTFASGFGIYSSYGFAISSTDVNQSIDLSASSGVNIGAGFGNVAIGGSKFISLGCASGIDLGTGGPISLGCSKDIGLTAGSGINILAATNIDMDAVGGYISLDSSTGISMDAAAGALAGSGTSVYLGFSSDLIFEDYNAGTTGAQIGMVPFESWVQANSNVYLSVMTGWAELRNNLRSLRVYPTNIVIDGDLVPAASGTMNVGSATLPFATGFFSEIRGARRAGVVTLTGNFSPSVSDEIMLCDTSGGAFQVTLPSAAISSGFVFNIKKISSDGSAITVSGTTGNIDGSSTQIITDQYTNMAVVSDGSNYYIL